MLTYSMCRSCGTPLIITTEGQREHDGCPPKLTLIEKLTADYLYTLEHHPDVDVSSFEKKIWELQHQPPNLRVAAMTYAAGYGWPVFPLAERGKQPAISKHNGGNGLHDATTDLEQIDRWWYQNPNFNIGIPTGIHFDVIDVDPPRGWESWHSIQKAVLPDVHGRVATQSAGAHFYVLPNPEMGNRAGIYPGIDYRGKGGYVVAPPSWLGENRYSWSWGVYPSPFILPTMKEIVDEWQRSNA